jgi:YfiH family protein
MSNVRRINLSIHADDSFLEIPLWPGAEEKETFDLRAGLSLHRAGHMEVAQRMVLPSRKDLYRRLQVDEERVFGLKQIHSRTVIVLDHGSPADYYGTEADGFVTALQQPILSVTVADCLPIFFFVKNGEVFGLVHSGWKGTGIVEEAVGLLGSVYKVKRSEIHAVIGPGIGAGCYAVPRERYEDFISRFGKKSGSARDHQYFLDLREANLGLLTSLGVHEVTVIDNCTHCNPLLGSYRRDGKENFHTMIALFGRF